MFYYNTLNDIKPKKNFEEIIFKYYYANTYCKS